MELAMRNAVVAAGRRLENQGLITAAEGNVSVRLGGGSFLITPAGTRKGELRPPQLVVMDAAGRSAGGTPSSRSVTRPRLRAASVPASSWTMLTDRGFMRLWAD